jgi:gluconolactonase
MRPLSPAQGAARPVVGQTRVRKTDVHHGELTTCGPCFDGVGRAPRSRNYDTRDASRDHRRIERSDARFDALIPPGTAIEKVAEGIDWAEGPQWDSRNDVLLFSDVPRNGVFSVRPGGVVTLLFHPSGYTKEQEFAGREPGSNGLAFDPEGRLVICQHGDRRIVRRETDGRFTVLADRYQGKRLNSPNDLVFRSNGDLYFTDPPFGLPEAFQRSRERASVSRRLSIDA